MTGRIGGRVHVVGAGLAGLAAAVDLVAQGYSVVLYEAGPHAGGRCRSFLDPELGVRIDNGNHLLLSGNTAALDYVSRIGATDTFAPFGEATIPFRDLETGEGWAVQPPPGRIPWWVLRAASRVPGTRLRDYLDVWHLARAAPADTVASVLSPDSMLFRRLWQPLVVAALNTAADDASARLLWRVIAETLGRGAAACRPLLPRRGLSESLVDPAVKFLAGHGGELRFGARLKELALDENRVTALLFDGATVALPRADNVVLAVPAAIAARLVPGLVVPNDFAPIVNAHFRCAAPPGAPALLGLVGGMAEWIFDKGEVISVTVSAADRLVDHPAEELRDALWRDVARALALPAAPVPPARIVKERRATFRASPAQLARRPSAATRWNNFHLAGDYIETGLPATIEGAIRSGFAAAARVRQCRSPLPATSPSAPAAPFPPTTEKCQRALP
jgi:squalene-associated FAD-dependent desaturase